MDLQRSLLWRVWLFGLLLSLLILLGHAWQVSRAAWADLRPTAAIVQQLLNQDQPRLADSFNRETIAVELATLAPLARRLSFCVEVDDVWRRLIAADCMRPQPPLPGAAWLAAVLARLGPGDARPVRLDLVRAPGVIVGEIRVAPDWASEASACLAAAAQLSLVWLALGVLAAVVVLPVRRALRPADRILEAIGRLEGGDTSVRLPAFELREFRRIGEDFNSLARQLAETRAAERRLTVGLLEAGEAERRRIAGELHDEMGQYLTSLRAELACLRSGGGGELPPGLGAISHTLGQMHESLQRILHALRPARLDAFGLRACLEQLVHDARRSVDGRPLACSLQLAGAIEALPAALEIHVYRIVQEGLTNALRHAGAGQVVVALVVEERQLSICIDDDGPAGLPPARPLQAGQGLLGMGERVAALGGRLELGRRAEGGTRLSARLPLRPDGALPA